MALSIPYEVRIGFRYLRARPQGFLSLITFISIGGVALGVMALIVVLAVMTGFERDLRNKILGTNAHLWVLKYGDRGIEEPAAVLAAVRRQAHVVAASPFTYGEVMLTAGGRTGGAVLRGIDLPSALQVTDIGRNLKEAEPALARAVRGDGGELDEGGIVLGRYLAANLGVAVGSTVDVVSPLGGELTPMGMAPRVRRFRVAGIFQVGFYEFDSKLAMVSIPAAQRFFRMGQAVSGIEVKVEDLYQADRMAAAIQAGLGFPYFTRTWSQMNRNLFAALRHEKVLMFIILALIVLVAAFGIVSVLIMVVMHKRKEIAILKAMGAPARGIMRVFMVEGLVIGVAGTVLGLMGGLAIAWNLDPISAALERLLGFQAFPQDIYLLDKLPSQVNVLDVAVITLTAMAISFLATVVPSWQAARVDPVVGIRYE